MRRFLPALVFVGLTSTLVAQTPQTPKVRVADTSALGAPTKIAFGQLANDGAVSQFTGGVKITVDKMLISADEVIWDKATQELRLRGDVRIKVLK